VAHLVQKHFGVANCQVLVTPMPNEMVKSYQWESLAHLDKLKSVIPDWNPQTVEQWLDNNFLDLYNKTLKEINNET